MTKIEKQTLTFMGLIVTAMIFTTYSACSNLEQAGGMKALIIEAGKEIKDISKEINKD